mgnify:CR=1 FL=1
MIQPAGAEWTSFDIYQEQFWWNFCTPVTEGASACNTAGVCQKAISASGYYSCGETSTMTMNLLAVSKWLDSHPVSPFDGVTIHLSNGAAYASGQRRQTDIHILCDPYSKALGVIELPGNQGYVIYMTSPFACSTRVAVSSGVVATDPTLGLIWHMNFNGTAASWDLLASNIQTPGNIGIDQVTDIVYWIPVGTASVIFFAPYKNISQNINIISPSGWTSYTSLVGLAAGDTALAVRYNSDRMAMITTSGTYFVQEPGYMLGAEIATYDSQSTWYIKTHNSGDLYGTLARWDVSTGLSSFSSPSGLLCKLDYQNGLLVLLDTSKHLYWVFPSNTATAIRTFDLSNSTLGVGLILDLAIDSQGMTYVLDNTPSIRVITPDLQFFTINIPSTMKIVSLASL